MKLITFLNALEADTKIEVNVIGEDEERFTGLIKELKDEKILNAKLDKEYPAMIEEDFLAIWILD